MNDYFLPGRGARTLWNNPRTSNNGTAHSIAPGERHTIVDIDGCGVIRKLWMTMDYLGRYLHPRNRERNQKVWIEIFWDYAKTPAVSAPVGDFFGHIMGRDVLFENAFFSDASARTFQTHIPMPFRKHVRIDIINHYDEKITMYHEFRATMEELPEDACYFHAHYNETISDEPGLVHTVLPVVHGKGRYLGTHLGFRIKPENGLEWQHGLFDFTIDSDHANMLTATIDDYCGSSWDYEHVYHHQDGGLLFSEDFPTGGGEHAIYCYHRRDPLYFDDCCGVTFRARHAGPATSFIEWYNTDPNRLKAILCNQTLEDVKAFIGKGGGHFNDYVSFYTNDDLYTVAYYYLDSAE